MEILTIEEEPDWRQPFLDYFFYDKLPRKGCKNPVEKKRAFRRMFINDTLYQKSYDQLWLRWLSEEA